MGIPQLHRGFLLLLAIALLPIYHAQLPPPPGGPPSKDNYWPFFKKNPDGSYTRIMNFDYVPPSLTGNPATKDVIINPKTNVTARLIYPGPNPSGNPTTKFPLVIYFHGGAFCIGSAYSGNDTKYIYALSTQAKAIILTVEYRLFPPTSLPAPYEDGWAALNWVAAHNGGKDVSEPLIANHVDFTKVYLGGDSSGANLAHNLLIRAGKENLPNSLIIYGGILAMPYFLSNELRPKGPQGILSVFNIWPVICPKCKGQNGMDDPCVNPMKEPTLLSTMAGSKVLVYLAGDDVMKPFGQAYVDAVKASGWKGQLKLEVADGLKHVFYIANPESPQAATFIKNVAAFINSA